MLNIKEIILEQQNNLSFKLKNKNCKVLKLIAIKEEREDLLKHHLKPGKFDVIIIIIKDLFNEL